MTHFSIPSKNRLYYYCKLNIALEDILPDYRLLLSPFNKTNDPRENKSFAFAALGEIEGSLKEQNERISKILQDDSKLICLSEDYKNYFGFELSRMWSYYGENHKGICLLIDKEEFLNENSQKIDTNLFRKINYWELDLKKIEHKMIDYELMKTIGKKTYLKNIFRNENLDYLYFTKNKEWETEREIRLLYFSENKEKEYCEIKKSLKGIYLGVDFHNSHLPSLIELCSHLNIYKMHYTGVRLVPRLIYEGR